MYNIFVLFLNSVHMKIEINANHPRIKNRTPEQQEYRDKLSQDLKSKKTKWELGLILAENHLKEKSETVDYILSKHGYTKSWAMTLLEKWMMYPSVLSDISKFVWLDKEIALLLIKQWKAISVRQNIGKFTWLDKDVAIVLIKDESDAMSVAEYIKRFLPSDHRDIAMSLMKQEHFGQSSVIRNIENFHWVDRKEIALMAINNYGAKRIVENLEKFEWALDQDVAIVFIKAWYEKVVVDNMYKFQWLATAVASALIEKWFGRHVEDNIWTFQS